MSRKILMPLIAGLMLMLSTAALHAQQPLGIISVDWNSDGAGAAPRNPELIYKSMKAAFADALKKKLNVNDPATVADLEMMRDGANFRFVIIPKGAVQPTQDEILAMVKDSFVDTVTTFFNDFHNKEVAQIRDQDERDLDLAKQKAALVRSNLAELRANLRAMTHRVDVSPETLRAAITRLEDERDKLALDVEAMGVRRKAVENTIAKISKTGEEQIRGDRIAVELAKLVDVRDVELKRMQVLSANKSVAQAEVEAAEAKVGEARVRLWERQEIVTRTAGGDLLADLNKELAMLSINMAESEARLDRLGKLVQIHSKAVDLIDELETVQSARQAAQQGLIEAESRLAERMRNLRQLQPPTVNLHARP